MSKIDEMRELERAATRGPWKLDALGAIDDVKIVSPWIEDAWTGDAEADANMEFIAHARQYVPWSLDEIDRLTADLAIAQREAAQAKNDMERYKAHSEAISALPDCNTCGIHKDCTVKPRPGEWVRINCHLWHGMEVEG